MFLRVRQIAKLTGLSRSTVLRAIERGELKAVRYRGYQGRKGSILVPQAEYDTWINTFFH